DLALKLSSMFVTSPLADNALVPQALRALKPELEAAALGPKHAGGSRTGEIFAQPLEERVRGSALALADRPLDLEHQPGAERVQLALSIVHPLLRQIIKLRPRFGMCLQQKTRIAKILPSEKAIGRTDLPLLEPKLRSSKRNLRFCGQLLGRHLRKRLRFRPNVPDSPGSLPMGGPFIHERQSIHLSQPQQLSSDQQRVGQLRAASTIDRN